MLCLAFEAYIGMFFPRLIVLNNTLEGQLSHLKNESS